MSRIFRSLDLERTKVTELDLRTKPMGAQNPQRPAGGFCGFQPDGPAQQALSDLERREQESMHLLDEARHQAEAIQRDAYRAGFEQGERAGEKLAQQKIDPVLQTFQTLIEAVKQERDVLIAEHEQELIKVAFAIAAQVLKRSIEMEPETIADVVVAALVKVPRTEHVTLRVSPYDAQMLEMHMRKRTGGPWPPSWLTMVADDAVTRGGCRIETEGGDVDATIETQLRALRSELWQA